MHLFSPHSVCETFFSNCAHLLPPVPYYMQIFVSTLIV
uniref:Uncharacterized protein n=1 Tax=Anguilla anguilla TaxID=7936 RepID=A0A0E9XY18_ANGAN